MPNKSNTEVARQELAEEIGELFRPYLNLEKINGAIHPTCGYCKPLRGSDGHTMLAQEFIGNLIKPALTRAQSQLAKEVLAAIKGVEAEYHAEKRLRDLFKRLNVSVDGGE